MIVIVFHGFYNCDSRFVKRMKTFDKKGRNGCIQWRELTMNPSGPVLVEICKLD